MAAGGKSEPATNGTQSSAKPMELAITLPNNPGTRIHLHLTVLASTIMLFVTSAGLDATPGASPMGSFVYAMPDRYNPSQPLNTPLYTLPSSQDFATRMAKVLASRTKRPCYVGSSVNLSGAVAGGTVEEEMEAFRAIVKVVMTGVERASGAHDDDS
ncbi:hypothetical protein LTR37_021086 [Vermiconidia calcicola]|uniref:Uncharacterized protein n=1 Tax=Vermiconidia calcicola TaxID=1690605 RepID=A0ACC3MBC4_9PEZI|nr:hypothetical protein LTR37_021086 [Vermiconidia calcicola]